MDEDSPILQDDDSASSNRSDQIHDESNKDLNDSKMRKTEESDIIARFLRPYCRFLVRWPSVVFVVVLVIFIVCLLLSTLPVLGAKKTPDFTNPAKGFEPRGTTDSKRSVAFSNLKEFQKYNLTNNPKARSPVRKIRSLAGHPDYKIPDDTEEAFFLAYQSSDSGNLFTATDMNNLCKLHKKYIKDFPNYSFYFKENTLNSHHLPSYMAYLYNQKECGLTPSVVDKFKTLLQTCVKYYKNHALESCMNTKDIEKCSSVFGSECQTPATVNDRPAIARLLYNTFHYLTDKEFANDPTVLKLTGSFDLLYWVSDDAQENFLKPLYEKHLKDLSSVKVGDVEVVAFHVGYFKFYMFNEEIVLQSLYIISAIILVILFIWFYSGSLFVGLMSFSCIIMALGISYFVYGRVFDNDFFPFLNMVTLIFLVGIGADDAFVYTGIWGEARNIYPNNNGASVDDQLTKWTLHTIRHAALSMLVTSLTTAAAFYANISSVVTSVKCLGLFAGTSIIVNYLLMITFFPAVVIIHEKYLSPCMNCCCPKLCRDRRAPASNALRIQKILDRISDRLFNRFLPFAVLKLRYIWIAVLMLLGIGGCIATFVKPGLNPPSTGEFQMFTSGSALEQYSLKYKSKFAFTDGSSSQYTRDVEFVFGVRPVDNGNKFDPDDRGTLELYDSPLDLASVQTWLHVFCQNLKNASFIKNSVTCDKLELMFQSLAMQCYPPHSIPGCCNQTLPMDSGKFMHCFRTHIELQGLDGYEYPLFDAKSGDLKVIVIEASTIYKESKEFQYNKKSFETVDAWFETQHENVTSPHFQGWWHIDDIFYTLQVGLFEGTSKSLGITIGVAFLVILCTTFNILLSLYSILTLVFIISITVGILILSGWRLNIFESIVFSVTAGLSADFTLHYSVAYKSSLFKHNRMDRVKGALSHIGPAVTMGATTTFIAGLVMLPSYVLVYLQMAQFLMLVMFISWVYSTLFFLPLCAFIGPTGNTGQLTSCSKKKKALRRSSSDEGGEHIGAELHGADDDEDLIHTEMQEVT